MLTLLAAAALAAPQPGELRTFGDWTVGCDNGRACQAVALWPSMAPNGLSLAVERGSAADAEPMVRITGRDKEWRDVKPRILVVDGTRIALKDLGNGYAAPVNGRGVAQRIAQAKMLVVRDLRGRSIGNISTQGSAAALLYMDEQQQRIGTTSALARRGRATRVPPAPTLPVIVRPASPKRTARALTVARARQMLGKDLTECSYTKEDPTIVSARLDSSSSLALVSHPCGNGAYNSYSTVYVVDEGGRARSATFDAPRASLHDAEFASSQLVNAGWDSRSHRLTTFSKGRGFGDCGVEQTYAWDGSRFRLVEEAVMGECRGSADYITTWRALVIDEP